MKNKEQKVQLVKLWNYSNIMLKITSRLGHIKKIFYKYFWEDLYYNVKFGLRNLYRYRKIVWQTGDYDYNFNLRMMKFQLELLLKSIEKGWEVDEHRLVKEADIKRCIEILKNIQEDNYLERCGSVYFLERECFTFEPHDYDLDGNESTYVMKDNRTPYEQTHDEIVRNKSRELEEAEWNELWSLMKNCRGWWD